MFESDVRQLRTDAHVGDSEVRDGRSARRRSARGGPAGRTARSFRDTAISPPVAVEAPEVQTIPFVFSSPHSGNRYPPEFVSRSRLDPLTLRRSEDSFVDEIFESAPAQGAPLVKALFPRAYVDPNRERHELDPGMFSEPLPDWVNSASARVVDGLGTIPRMVYEGAEIYADKLSVAEVEERLVRYYDPYHASLSHLLAESYDTFGCAVLVDCHSMPSVAGPLEQDTGYRRPDIVLGNGHGRTCAPIVTEMVERVVREFGCSVVRNNPYAGGYNTVHYGRPHDGVHAIQIEINRALYMDEARVARAPGIARMKALMRRVVAALTAIPAAELRRRTD